MTVVCQREGVRLVTFNKCGGTSLTHTFMSRKDASPAKYASGSPISTGDTCSPVVLNTGDAAKQIGGMRGDLTNIGNWPKPKVIIGILRNPARRALSAWHHFLVRKERYKFEALGFTFGMSFPDFVSHLETIEDLTVDVHLAPFTPDLLAAGDKGIPYLLAPLEMIQQCWATLMADVGLEDVLQTVAHENNGYYNHNDFMTPELDDRIRAIYSQDYNLWEAIYYEAGAEISSVSDATH